MFKSSRNMFYLIQVVVGWEYFVSGWNKLVTAGFPYQLAKIISDQIKDSSGWYVNFLKSFVIPNAPIFGYLVEFGEILAGLALIISSLILIFRKHEVDGLFKSFSLVLIIASAATAFMSINYWLMSGAPSFLPGAQDPTAEGMDIDALLASIDIIFICFNIIAFRNASREHRS